MFAVFLISILTLIAILIVLGYFIIKNKKITNKILIILGAILVVALALIACCIEPKETNDLYRHFKCIDLMREYGTDAITEYDTLPATKGLFYLVSLLPTNHLLPFISAIIIYGIFMFIIYDFNKRNDITSRVVAIGILLNFAMCTYATCISGIRNAMAFAFIALALYMDLIRKEKPIKTIWPYIIAVCLHPASWLVIAIRIIYQLTYKLKHIDKLKYLILLIGLFPSVIINVLYFINLDATIYIADKLHAYTMHPWQDDIRLLCVLVILLICIYIVTIWLKRKNNEIEYLKYINFLQFYILVIFGSMFIDQIFIKRLTILLAFLMIPLVYLIENNSTKKQKLIIYGITIFFITGLVAYSVVQVRGNMSFVFLN